MLKSKKNDNIIDKPNEYLSYLNSDHYSFGKYYIDGNDVADKSSNALILLLSEDKLENQLSTILAEKFNINSDAYDKAIDSYYNTTNIGGPTLHHNLDGAHTFEGALKILREKFPDDSDFKLITEIVEHFSRDLTTPSGINPFLSPNNFNVSKDYLMNNLEMSASSVNDLLNINAVELGAVVIATLSIIYNFNDQEIDKIGEYFSRISLISIIAGNPAMLFLSFILMGQSFIALFKGKEFMEFLDGGVNGILSTATFYYATATLPGPIFPILLIALASSFGASWLYKRTKKLFKDDLDDIFLGMFPAYKSYLKIL